jgi:ornithine decarboxylase
MFKINLPGGGRMEKMRKLIELSRNLQTPFVLLDLEILKENYIRLKENLPFAEIFYAVKANSHPRIINTLKELGSSFDVASAGEIEKLLKLGVTPDKMSFGNTIKKEKDIKFAYSFGIDYYAVDTEMELEKIAHNAPGSKVYFRLIIDSNDSDWPLSRKFGTTSEHIKSLAIYAKTLGLIPYGISFHVGSQCNNKFKWREALKEVASIFKELKLNDGINMSLINLGGGMPVEYDKPIPTVEEISDVIRDSIEEYFYFVDDLKIIIEPGRSMVGNIGLIGSSVLLRSKKPDGDWVYLDVGIFHGLTEAMGGIRYKIIVDGKEKSKTKTFKLAGPTCDSIDIMYEAIELPEDITLNDRVYILNTGAYTTEYVTNFNGIYGPSIYFVQDIELEKLEVDSINSTF